MLSEDGGVDLVLTDVMMPGMTGPELVGSIGRDYPDIAVLFVTGYVGDSESETLVGHELLRKPFTVGALASAVATALQPTEPPRTSGVAGAR
jgi:CheY-like chemotaxis protein